MLQRAQVLSPVEAARRLGTSTKALRLYEQHGLVRPLRAANGWRAYGPEEMARLHQVLALKRLGLSLAQIASLIRTPEGSLSAVLALQEESLCRESARVSRALELVRAARAKLDAGDDLSVDDLAELTKETTMTREATPEELKAIFDPLTKKHFEDDKRTALSAKKFDQVEISRRWEQAIADAKAAMAKGDPASPEAQDVARRWKELIELFTGGNPEFARKANAVWQEAMADPKAAPRLPLNPEIFAFMQQAVAKLGGK
jgi:DNA-binding transcriptional MerR regulator